MSKKKVELEPSLTEKLATADANYARLESEMRELPEKLRAALDAGDEQSHQALRAREAELPDVMRFAFVAANRLRVEHLIEEQTQARDEGAELAALIGQLSESHRALLQRVETELRESQSAIDRAVVRQRAGHERIQALQREIGRVESDIRKQLN